MSGDLVVVAGGGGFIGGHLVANLLSEGHRVRSVDLKPPTSGIRSTRTRRTWSLDLR